MVLQSLKTSRKLGKIMRNQKGVNQIHHKPVVNLQGHHRGSQQEDPVQEEEAEQARQAATIAQSLVALRQTLATKKVPEMTEAKARDIELKKREGKEEEKGPEEEKMKRSEAGGERKK